MKNHEVVKKIILTEDSYELVQDADTVVFEVAREANKVEIRKAVEGAFGVRVKSVNTMITASKIRTVRGKFAKKVRHPGYKKAFVKVLNEDLAKIPLI
jgi:large subunit ribosomal protein L23